MIYYDRFFFLDKAVLVRILIPWFKTKKKLKKKDRCEIGIILTAAIAFLFEALELFLFQILICKAYDSETLKFA